MDTFARCPACGRMIPTKADYCPLCGAKLRLVAKMPKPDKPERKPDEAAKPEPELEKKRTRFSASDARRAVVAAEILSPPVSKRRR